MSIHITGCGVICTYPLIVFPAVRVAEQIFWDPKSNKGQYKIQKNIFRFLLVGTWCACACEGFRNLNAFISFMGALFCVPMALIYPPLMIWCFPDQNKLFLSCQICFGIFCMLYSTYNSLRMFMFSDTDDHSSKVSSAVADF